METYNVTLTAAEIEMLQICLSGMRTTICKEVNTLAEFNENGVYTDRMKMKFERIKDCDEIWRRLNSVLPAYQCRVRTLDEENRKRQMIFGKEKLVFYVAKTYINCHMKPDVSILITANNGWEEMWSSDLNDPRIKLFDTEEAAKAVAYAWANTDMTVHPRWVKAE